MQLDHDALLCTFRLEAEDLLCELERLAFDLDERPDDVALVAEMFRCAHTLKGGASCVGFERVMLHAYELEGLFEAVSSQRCPPNRQLSALSLDAVNFLRQGVRVDAKLAAEPIPEEQQFITRILDWIDSSGKDSSSLNSPTNAQILARDSRRTLRLNVERVDEMLKIMGELSNAANRLRPDATADSMVVSAWESFESLVQSLRMNLIGIRLVPVGPTLEHLGRPIRDLSRESGKQVELVIEGREVKVDIGLADTLSNPLMHLVRNAIVHGIETPEGRRELGKEPTGRITLRAVADGEFVIVQVADDGAGIVAEGNNGTPASLLGSEGGMEVVRREIEGVGGSITLDGVPGQGVTVTLRIPRTV